MTDDQVTRSVSFTAEAMIPPPFRTRWQRLKDWLRHRPAPQATNPPGTQPLIIDTIENGMRQRIYIPAARFGDGPAPDPTPFFYPRGSE